ncbi:MAG: TonB C-terminal domain-containing protein [Myxococcota bacterium]
MRRFVDPAILAFAVALLVSLGLHVPAYQALGVLADRLLTPTSPPRTGTEVEFTVADDSSSGEADDSPADPETPDEAPEEPSRPEDSPEAPQPTPPPEPVAEQEKPDEEKPEEEEPEEEPKEPRQAEAETAHQLAVKQHSEDPDVERPDNAEYLAEENNRVEEETVARNRNDVRDDADPNPGKPHEGPPDEADPGSADETEVAEMRDKDGSDAREPTPEEAADERPDEVAEVEPSPVPSGVVGEGATSKDAPGGQGEEGPDRASEREVAAQQEQEAAPSGEPDMVEVHDGYGTMRVPRARAGRDSTGGEGKAGESRRKREEREGKAGRRGAGRGADMGDVGPNRRFAWSELEDLYGRERLDEERQAYLKERKSERRGSNRQEKWEEFRSAIENFVPNVRPGNQTALNAAASPFAEYISDVHRRIHRQYADEFLANLPTFSSSPYADQSLVAKLEIILNRDGTVHRVGVVNTSGFLPFDYGAFSSVMRAQPYPEPPSAILSGDGRVYFHWGFYRNARQCGTFNAEPYILPKPPGTEGAGGGPLQDEPNYGGVVPDEARPDWGSDDEGDSEGGDDDGSENDEGGEPRRDEGDDERESPEGEPPRRRPQPGGGSALG